MTEPPHLVVLPGLGLRGYLAPLLTELALRGAAVTLLDLPGHAARACPPTVPAVAATAAAWLRSRHGEEATAGPVVVLGHSTGAQAALHAVLACQDDVPVARLVLAGPTVAPAQRGLLRLAVRAPLAYRHDSPRELVVLGDLLCGPLRVLSYLRSGIQDRPEDAVTRLRVPAVLTAGGADSFAPATWLDRLASRCGAAASVRVCPGSHNNPFTHPVQVADAALSGL